MKAVVFSLLRLGAILLTCALVFPISGANMSPVSVTGFNRDVVVENTASGPPFAAYALEFNIGEGRAFYQSGLPGYSLGLPANRTFTSNWGDGTQFQLQPYNASNVLLLSNPTGVAGTLNLVSPAPYKRIAILATSGSGGGDAFVTLNFSNGTSFTTNYSAPDWFNNPGYALNGFERIDLATGDTQGAPDNPRFYQTTIDIEAALGAPVPTLQSVTFERANATTTGIFALSGEVANQFPVTITQQPTNQSALELTSASFTVRANGIPAPVCQWYRGASPVPGATNFTLTVAPVLLADHNAQFRAVLQNTVSNITYNVTSTVATLSVVADTNPPVLLSARSIGLSQVELFFSEALTLQILTNTGNYSLSSTSGPVAVLSATNGAYATNILLAVPALTQNALYTLTVSNLADLSVAKNTVTNGSQVLFYALPYIPQEIGSSVPPGGIVPEAGGLNVSGGGAQIGGNADQFHFSWQPRSGNFDVRVRVESLTLTDPWAEAGLMARATLSPDSETAAALATPTISGSYFAWRTAPAAQLSRAGAFPVNYPHMWLRLQRSGSTFAAYASRDGSLWSLLGSASISMPSTVYLGYAVSSRNTNSLTTAKFRQASDVSNPQLSLATPDIEPIGQSSRRTSLVISEINYHPPDVLLPGSSQQAELEFVEIINTLGEPQDISGYRLSGDVDYTFPPGSILAGGAVAIVARSPGDISAIYGPGITTFGPWEGAATNGLPNDSGTIRLRHRSGAVFLEVDYSHNPPWPAAADGAGHSLVLARPSYGEHDPRAWAPSDRSLGSPGRIDPFTSDPADPVLLNEILAHTDPPLSDYIELYNHSNESISLDGYILTDDASTNKFVISGSIPARGFLHFTEEQLGFSLSSAGETIYFINPDRSRVLDSLRFGGQENAVALGRFPNGAPDWYRLESRTPSLPNANPLLSSVLINEIMYNPISGDDDLQYIELLNRAATPADISGWRFEDGINFTFPQGTVIPAGSYLVVARQAAKLRAAYPQLNTLNSIGDFSGSLSGRGERLAISKPDTVISTNSFGVVSTNTIRIVVDELTYGTGPNWGTLADRAGSSLELKDPRANRRLAFNWADSDESSKAPWTLVEARGRLDNPANANNAPANQLQVLLLGVGECLIDDVQVISDAGSNYVANSTFQSGATGWTAEGACSTSGLDTTQGYNSTRSYRIRTLSRSDNQINRVRTPLTSTIPSGTIVTIRARVRWLQGHPEIILRLRGNWFEAPATLLTPPNPGTPGLANSRAINNAPPAIYQVAHTPVLPAAAQSLVVSARAQDPDRLGSFTLHYRVDPGTLHASVNMLDNGAAGDAVANDGIYSATIPAQPAGALVAYYVQASDLAALPATARYPLSAPVEECLVKFGETTPVGNFPVYRLWMTQATFNQWDTRKNLDNSPNSVTFVLGGHRVIHSAAARFAGSPYIAGGFDNPSGKRCGYTIDIPNDDLFLGDNALVLDWPGGHGNETTAVQEQMAWWIADQMNLPYSYRHFIRLYVNGVSDMQRTAVFEAVLQPSGEYLNQWSPGDTDGEFYKIDRAFEFSDSGSLIADPMPRLQIFTTPDPDSGLLRKDLERYRWNWLKRSYNRALDLTNLMTVVDALNSPAPEPYTAHVQGLIDLPNFLGAFAFCHVINNFDSWGHVIGKNMYMYKPQNGKWQQYAFDLDWLMLVSASWSSGQYGPTSTRIFDCDDPTVTRMYNHPPFRREYLRAIRNSLTPLDNAIADPLMNAKYASLLANGITHCDNQPLTPPTAVKNWFALRRATLQAILAPYENAPFAITDDPTVISSNLYTLRGTAPLGTDTITINGQPWNVTWTSLTNWSVSLPINPGLNDLLVAAVQTGASTNTILRSVTSQLPAQNPANAIAINEINFAPTIPGAQFVELLNTSATHAFDLSGWRFDGIDLTFPSGSLITPGQHLLLVRDRSAFLTLYGSNLVPAATFSGNLRPDADALSLTRPISGTNQTIARLKYRNAIGWPLVPMTPDAQAGASAVPVSYQLRSLTLADRSRPAAWSVAFPGAPQEPRWISVTTNITVSSTTFYLYLASPGDIYLDDLRLAQGGGPNLLANGDFESPLASTWTTTANFTNSTRSSAVRRVGSYALHLVATAAGSGGGNSISQTVPGISPGTYTLSFHYLQTTNASPLVLRFSGSPAVSIHPAPPLWPEPPAATASTLPVNSVAATPGASNTVIGSLPALPPLYLNEILPINTLGLTNSLGQRLPWVEIFNPAATNVTLSGLFLTTNPTNPAAWAFPDSALIPARSFAIVRLGSPSGTVPASEYHAPLPVASHGHLLLSRLSTNAQFHVLDLLSWTNLPPNRAFGSIPDAQSFHQRQLFFPTPGATNNPAAPALTVAINEWMSDNTRTIADPADGGFEDWFELFNYGDTPVNLGGFHLTDDLTDPTQSTIPDNGHYIIPPRGFLLVWADNEPAQNSTNRADLHVNFALSRSGDSIGLFAPDASPIDTVTFAAQATDLSAGRSPDGFNPLTLEPYPIADLPLPTPRAPNVTANQPPAILNWIPTRYLHLGQTLNLLLQAVDDSTPPQNLTWTLDVPVPAGATIDPASRVLTWTPTPAQLGPTTLFLRVSDAAIPPGSTPTNLLVHVQEPLAISALSTATPGQLSLTFQTWQGLTYALETAPTLMDPQWTRFGSTIQGNNQNQTFQIPISGETNTQSYFRLIVITP